MVAARISIIAIVIGTLIHAVSCFVINAVPNKRLFEYSIFEQLQDTIPSALISIVMGVSVWGLGLMLPNTTIIVFLQILFGVIIYVLLTYLLRKNDYFYVVSLIKQLHAHK